MDLLEPAAILLAGVAAGTINTVAGSGTLVTFPVLVAFGYSPVTATMSNVVGLLPGNITGTLGYRRELDGQWRRLRWQMTASAIGTAIGIWLLLHLPETTFKKVVPVLLAISLIVVAAQPQIQSWTRRAGFEGHRSLGGTRRGLLILGTFLTGIYGGYFGAAQGIMLVAIMGALLHENLQRINGAKNVLILLVNLIAAVGYIVVAPDRIAWHVVALIAIGTLMGGVLGARYGRRLKPGMLRALIIAFGTVALVRFVAT